jgi:hypothetical protein
LHDLTDRPPCGGVLHQSPRLQALSPLRLLSLCRGQHPPQREGSPPGNAGFQPDIHATSERSAPRHTPVGSGYVAATRPRPLVDLWQIHAVLVGILLAGRSACSGIAPWRAPRPPAGQVRGRWRRTPGCSGRSGSEWPNRTDGTGALCASRILRPRSCTATVMPPGLQDVVRTTTM